jgi:hypothetical protein
VSLYETKRALGRIAQSAAVLAAATEAAEAEAGRPAFRCKELSRGMEMTVAIATLNGPDPTGVMISVGNLYLNPKDAAALGQWLLDVCLHG